MTHIVDYCKTDNIYRLTFFNTTRIQALLDSMLQVARQKASDKKQEVKSYLRPQRTWLLLFRLTSQWCSVLTPPFNQCANILLVQMMREQNVYFSMKTWHLVDLHSFGTWTFPTDGAIVKKHHMVAMAAIVFSATAELCILHHSLWTKHDNTEKVMSLIVKDYDNTIYCIINCLDEELMVNSITQWKGN